MWIGVLGAYFLASGSNPMSPIIMLSTPMWFKNSKYSGTRDIFSLCARIFAVIYTFTSLSCAYLIACSNSSFEKFVDAFLIPNSLPAI